MCGSGERWVSLNHATFARANRAKHTQREIDSERAPFVALFRTYINPPMYMNICTSLRLVCMFVCDYVSAFNARDLRGWGEKGVGFCACVRVGVCVNCYNSRLPSGKSRFRRRHAGNL